MNKKSLTGSAGRNIFNLFLVFLVLTVITACVCRKDRDGGDTGRSATETAPAGETTVIAEKDTKEDKGDFIVEHLGVNNPRYQELDRRIRQDKTLEKAADQLNRSLILPNDIYMRTTDCGGDANAYYNPNDRSISMCYELMEHFYQLFRRAGESEQAAYDSMFDATRFIFLHEIGHALIDNYKLPVTANEEDAADRCSSFICIEELGDDGVRAILAAADGFRLEAKGTTPTGRQLADEHLLQEQRFYNSLCMVYGSNPDKYSEIVTEGYLPEARAVRCPAEYERTAESWNKLLAPWRKS